MKSFVKTGIYSFVFVMIGLFFGYIFFYDMGPDIELEPTYQAGAMFKDTAAVPPMYILINSVDTVSNQPTYLYTMLIPADSAESRYRILFGNRVCTKIDYLLEEMEVITEEKRDHIFGVSEPQGLR